MKELKTSLKAFAVFSLFLGLAYPVLMTVAAKLIVPGKANGSIIVINDESAGSELIGQFFNKPEYFHGRPSVTDYNACGSGASNLGPSNAILMKLVADRIKEIRVENNVWDKPLPADMVLASASGLDPHISEENAGIQAKRVSRIRNIPIDEIKKLIIQNTDDDFLGIWGCRGVNVLKLNIDLKTFKMKQPQNPKG